MTTSPADNALALRQAALDFAEGWYQGEAERMQRCFHPGLAKRAIKREPQTGKESLYHLTREQMVNKTKEGGGTDTSPDRRYYTVKSLDIV